MNSSWLIVILLIKEEKCSYWKCFFMQQNLLNIFCHYSKTILTFMIYWLSTIVVVVVSYFHAVYDLDRDITHDFLSTVLNCIVIAIDWYLYLGQLWRSRDLNQPMTVPELIVYNFVNSCCTYAGAIFVGAVLIISLSGTY